MEFSLFLGYAGVLNVALLAAALLVFGRRSLQDLLLALFLALSAIALAAILVTHEVEGADERLAIAAEHVAVLAAAPSLYLYVRAAMGRTVRPIEFVWFFAPAVLFLLSGAPAIILGRMDQPAAELIVGYHVGFTIATMVVFVRFRPRRIAGAHEFWWPVTLIGAMLAVHAGQAARLLGAAGDNDSNIVPLLGGLGAIAGLFVGLASVQTVQRRAAARYAKSPLGATHLRQCHDALVQVLTGQAMYRRPDLTLAGLAGAAGVSEKHASQALSEVGQTSFHALLAQARTEEAARLLRLPENAGVAVEPIGMEAGFRSRSAFYTAFRAATGMTPAEYRKSGAGIASDPLGQDTVIPQPDRKNA